jgi:hypothetical protein
VRTAGVPGGDLPSWMDSLFWGLCCFHAIPAEQVMLKAPDEDGAAWHWPAFRVACPGVLDMYAETSDGSNDAALRPLREEWRRPGRLLAVLYREDLDVLRDSSRPAQFAARLKARAR